MARRAENDPVRQSVAVMVRITEQERERLQQLRQELSERVHMSVNQTDVVRYLINNTQINEDRT